MIRPVEAPADGGPVHPSSIVNDCSYDIIAMGTRLSPGGKVSTTGMSLRDYFAAKAMAALIAGPEAGDGTDHYDDESNDNTAVRAYLIADAMLKARARIA